MYFSPLFFFPPLKTGASGAGRRGFVINCELLVIRGEKVDAPSATILYGFRLPSLRDCAGMTVVRGG